MAISLENNNISKISLGDIDVNKISLGDIEVWNGSTVWNKYNSILQYAWRRYNISYTYSEVKGVSDYGYIYDSETVYRSYSINASNGTFNYLMPTTPNNRPYDEPFYIRVSSTTIRKCIQTGSGGGGSHGEGYIAYSCDEYSLSSKASRGTFVSNVTSTSSTAYPTNGQSGSYWYDTRTSAYIRGTTNYGTVEADEGTYPNNGRHTDGFWYVKI